MYLESNVYPLSTCPRIEIRVIDVGSIEYHLPLTSSELPVDCDCLESKAQTDRCHFGCGLGFLHLRHPEHRHSKLGLGFWSAIDT